MTASVPPAPGMIAIPYDAIFEAFGPLVEAFGYVFVVALWYFGRLETSFALLFFLFAILYDICAEICAIFGFLRDAIARIGPSTLPQPLTPAARHCVHPGWW